MKKTLGLIFVLALMATPVMAQKVTIDYAHDFDFESVKTFTYVDTEDTNVKGNDLMAGRVSSMIRQELIQGGLKEVKEGGDLYVTYHFSSQDNTVYNTTNFGYGGYGRRLGWLGLRRWHGHGLVDHHRIHLHRGHTGDRCLRQDR